MKRKILRIIGIFMIICGVSVLSVFGYRKISRELHLRQLLKENVVLEIPALHIKVPVLEGTDNEILSCAAGHFPNTGAVGHGNYCIAGHNSTIYAEIFNDLDKIQTGDTVYLTDTDQNRTQYTYTVKEYRIVPPNTTEVLKNTGDNRLTIISCTDDGKYRQVVTAISSNS